MLKNEIQHPNMQFKHKIIVSFFIILQLLSIYLVFINKHKFSPNISSMLPDTKELDICSTYLKLQEKQQQLYIMIQIKDTNISLNDLLNYKSKLEQHLKLNSQLKLQDFNIKSFINTKNIISYLPYIFDTSLENNIEKQLNMQTMEQIFKKNYYAMILPTSTVQKKMIIHDPLLLSTFYLQKISTYQKTQVCHLTIKNGSLLSQDETTTIIKLNPMKKLTTLKEKENLIKAIENIIIKNPLKGVKVDLISNILHSYFNEKIIRRDISLSVTVISIILILLFIATFKDINSLYIFLVPVLAIIPALAIISLFLKSISIIPLGFGAAMLSICVDYGIHMIASIKSHNAKNAFSKIKKPLLLSFISTISAFSIFLFSNTPGLQQLALFAILSLSFSIIIIIYFSPVFIKKYSYNKNLSIKLIKTLKCNNKISLILWGLLGCISLYSLKNLKLETDIKIFDNAPLSLKHAENEFISHFINKNDTLLLTSGKSLEEILLTQADISIKYPELVNISSIYPPLIQQQSNVKRWKLFWKKHLPDMKNQIIKLTRKYNFKEKSFLPFVQNIIDSQQLKMNQAKNNLLIQNILSDTYLADDNNHILTTVIPKQHPLLKKYPAAYPECAVFDINEIQKTIYNILKEELVKFGLIAFSLIFLLIIFTTRNNLKNTLLTIPLIYSTLATLSILAILQIPANLAHFTGMIIVLGLSIDYGAFMLLSDNCNKDNTTQTAVIISFVTTMIGSGVLIFSHHNFVKSLGTAIFIGIITSFFTSYYILPQITKKEICK